jgi:hypothetical protein
MTARRISEIVQITLPTGMQPKMRCACSVLVAVVAAGLTYCLVFHSGSLHGFRMKERPFHALHIAMICKIMMRSIRAPGTPVGFGGFVATGLKR